MIVSRNSIATILCLLLCLVSASAETVELEAAKDNFGRTNRRNQNSGGNPVLFLAHSPMLRSIIAFDLSSVTNEILSAELVFETANTQARPIDLVIAPMVYTVNNAKWQEGTGANGAQGRNAMVGESTFSRRAFPDEPWETASGAPATGLGDDGLWEYPLIRLRSQTWNQGYLLQMKLDAAALLETIRNADKPVITFGIWGVAGNGHYAIASKESGRGPRLILTLKEDETAPKKPDPIIRPRPF